MQTVTVRIDRTEAEGIDVQERARRTAIQVTERTTYPHRALMRDLIVIGCAILRLHDAKHTETEQRLVQGFVSALISDLNSPVTPEMLEVAALHESQKDAREQMAQDLRLHRDSLEKMEAHKLAIDEDIAASQTYSRCLGVLIAQEKRKQAQELALNRTARERLGLDGVA